MYHYHPLVLEILGKQFGCNSKAWKVELDAGNVFNRFRERRSEHPIFYILRKSFDALTLEDQLLLINASLFCP